MKHINKDMIGMKLKEYTFRINSEIVTALDNYEMREGEFPSLTFIINNFLENLMIDNGFLKEPEVELTDVITPFEVETNSKTKRFKRINQGGNIRLYCGDLDFSSHNPNLIDEIENKLNEYSDEELSNLAINNQSQFNVRLYKRELYLRLGLSNPINIINIYFDERYGTFRVYATLNSINYNFGSHTCEDAEKVYEFLNNKPVTEIINYSSRIVGKKGKSYNKWLFSEMEKEKLERNTD